MHMITLHTEIIKYLVHSFILADYSSIAGLLEAVNFYVTAYLIWGYSAEGWHFTAV